MACGKIKIEIIGYRNKFIESSCQGNDNATGWANPHGYRSGIKKDSIANGTLLHMSSGWDKDLVEKRLNIVARLYNKISQSVKSEFDLYAQITNPDETMIRLGRIDLMELQTNLVVLYVNTAIKEPI